LQADAITLELHVVDQAHTVSEFEPHGKQTLEVDEAHYHFQTAPNIKMDAAALLDSLKSSSFAIEGGLIVLRSIMAGVYCVVVRRCPCWAYMHFSWVVQLIVGALYFLYIVIVAWHMTAVASRQLLQPAFTES
jgi:hypothetical protein